MGEGPDENEPPRRSSARLFALGILVALAVAAVVSYVVSRPATDAGRAASTSVRKGPSCPALTRAENALHHRNLTLLRGAIRAAAHIAFASLKRDDMVFGKSERIALQLGSMRLQNPLRNRQRSHIAVQLRLALTTCQGLSNS